MGQPDCARNCVVLWARDGEFKQALATLQELTRHTASPADFFLIASGPLIARMQDAVGSGSFIPIAGHHTRESAFVLVLTRFHERGFFYVCAGATIPDAWDQRLLWSLDRHDGTGTITPLLIAPVPPEIPSGDAFDRLCYQYGSREPHAAAPVLLCLYVAAPAARCVFQEWALSGARASFETFVEILEKARFRSILADHIGVVVPVSARQHIGLVHLHLAERVRQQAAAGLLPDLPVRFAARPRQLHVLHSWGGGLARWVDEYCNADHQRDNFLLKSIGAPGAFGCQLWLFRNSSDAEPIRRYALDPYISSTAVAHEKYAAVLMNVIEEFGIESMVISSLIGHSLDVLRTGLPTAMVCHDYYPFCSALNITFHSLCHSCNEVQLAACVKQNPHNRFFNNVPVSHWMKLRDAFSATVRHYRIPLIAPSKSVASHYNELLPPVEELFQIIPHGTRQLQRADTKSPFDGAERLRIVVLGALSPNKGSAIIREIKDDLIAFADLFLVGAGEDGRQFAGLRGIHVIERYEWDALPEIMAGIAPHLSLLVSVMPETFSFTLQELLDLGVPVLATRLGSFADRIAEGETGFLAEPSGDEILARIRYLDAHRDELAAVWSHLRTLKHRSLQDMLHEYEEVLGPPLLSAKGYFAEDNRVGLTSAKWTRCQVFWRRIGESYTEAASSTVRYALLPAPQKLYLKLPPLPADIELCLDPSEIEGVFTIHSVTVADAEGTVLWTRDGRASDGAGNVVCLNGSGCVCAFDNDPRLSLPLAKDALYQLSAGGVVEVQISCLPISESIAILRAECRKSDCKPELTALLGRLLAARQETAAQSSVSQRELQQSQKRVQELEQSLSWRITAPLRALAETVPAVMKFIVGRGRSGA